MDNLQGYQIKTPDWRTSLRRNERNTRNVILIFFIIYIIVGFIIDVYLNAPSMVNVTSIQELSHSVFYGNQTTSSMDTLITSELSGLKAIAYKLITFKIFPTATFGMILLAGFSVFIVLLFHRGLVLSGTEYREVTADNAQSRQEKQLYNVIEELRIASGLKFMPKVYVLEANYMNAFASGYSEKSALVAITQGLLQKLDRSELQAVMAHELSHIRHNDIRLTITVTLLSNLILIALDLMFRGAFYTERRDNTLVIIILLARFLLPVLTILLVMYLSRTREYMADAGSVELTRDNEPLARALIKIHQDTLENQEAYQQQYSETPNEQVRQTSYFYDPRYAGIITLKSINDLFSTHPSLESRLLALGISKKDLKK
jgi:heat shock protein HtpX